MMRKMEKKPSVLVAIPTNRVKYYCLGKLLKSLKRLEDADEIIFADDTRPEDQGTLATKGQSEEYADLIREMGHHVIRVTDTTDLTEQPVIRERLVNTRRTLREYFLSTDHTHIMFIDSDMIVPKDTIKRLLEADENIVSGVYWQQPKTKGGNGKPYAVAYKYIDKESYEMGINKFGVPLTFDDLVPSRVIGQDEDDTKITAIGLGCCLIKREVMESEEWVFRYEPNKPTTEDMWFSLDLHDLGYRICVDSSIMCRHYPQAWRGPL